MSIFSKAVYKETELPFTLDETDAEGGIIDIEAYGNIDGEYKYCYSGYVLKDRDLYDNGGYEQMLELLKNSEGKKAVIRLKYKKNRLVDFKMDIESLVRIYSDERFRKLELIGWGLHDKSIAFSDEDIIY